MQTSAIPGSSKHQQRESIWQSADIDSREILHQLLQGNPWPELITYEGPACGCGDQSQQATCALVAMYCARTILDLEKQVRSREYRNEPWSAEEEAAGFLDDIIAERTVQRIVSIGRHLKGATKMTPTELLDIPLFERVFVSSNRIECSSSYDGIKKVLEHLCKENRKQISSTVLTQGLQNVVCLRLPILEESLFIVFDPHRRGDHPNGPAFMLSASRWTTAEYLMYLLDTDDVTAFGAHILSPKERYHAITGYHHEQMLRESFLCAHEDALSASIDYVNLWNHILSLDEAGPSRSRPVSSASSSSTIALERVLPLPPLPLRPPPPLPASRITHVSESWRPESPFGLQLLESLKSISHEAAPFSDLALRHRFDCAVCLDTFPVISSVQMMGCEHRFCKECLKGHIQSFLDIGRYPIECPVCLLDRSIPDPGNVTHYVMNRLQMPQHCSDKFEELQILQHSIRFSCPRCDHPELIPRKDYLLAKTLCCTSITCLNKWCKFCSASVAESKRKHSCKGDPFEKTMKKRGWKHCPGCTIPVQKDSGCNHMACPAPGCHTHFCYKCGKSIITSATGRGVGEEVTNHYTNGCRQFERRLKCSIQ